MTVTWVETTEKRFDEMLGVLPPAAYAPHFMGFTAFQVGEPMSMRDGQFTFAAFKQEGEKFYESNDALTFKEFASQFTSAKYGYCG